MALTESIRAAMKTKPRKFKSDLLSLAKAYGVFLFGIATTLLFTNSLKFSIGRLRPHFFDLCKPDMGKANCTDGIDRKSTRAIPRRLIDSLTDTSLSIPCGNISRYDALILIHTAHSHFLRRHEYRQTYGNYRFTRPYRFKVVFLLGQPLNSTVQNLLEKENHMFRDTVQGSFADTYRNLTYKAITGFRWASKNCRHINLVIKMDDDVLFNAHKFFEEFWPQPRYVSNMLHCHGWKHPFVDRHGKWAITKDAFGETIFPPYCSGFFVVIPPHLVHDFYRAGRAVPFLWIDDVFIYGIVRKYIGAQFVYMEQLAHRAGQVEECKAEFGDRCKYIGAVLDREEPFLKNLLSLIGGSLNHVTHLHKRRYISDYECTNTEISHRLLNDSRLSFPSGHASFSMYSALFTIFYIQSRMQVNFSYLLKPLIQMCLMMGALLCCVSRITDNKHFPSDVAAGTAIGVSVAWLSFYKLAEKVIPTREKETPSAIKRAVSIESEPQTPTPLLRPERLVLNHHLHHNGYRNGSSNLIKEDV